MESYFGLGAEVSPRLLRDDRQFEMRRRSAISEDDDAMPSRSTASGLDQKSRADDAVGAAGVPQ
jgi:hypothetical protein